MTTYRSRTRTLFPSCWSGVTKSLHGDRKPRLIKNNQPRPGWTLYDLYIFYGCFRVYGTYSYPLLTTVLNNCRTISKLRNQGTLSPLNLQSKRINSCCCVRNLGLFRFKFRTVMINNWYLRSPRCIWEMYLGIDVSHLGH